MPIWPQITYIVLTAMGLGLSLEKSASGKKPFDFIMSLVVGAAMLGILYFGNFFASLGFPA